MDASTATAAAAAVATSVGLTVEESVVLHSSNKVTVRLLPCDVVARVAPGPRHAAQFEIDLAQHLVAARCPVAAVEPRVDPQVYEQDGFMVTLWTHYSTNPADIAPADYAHALERLHAGMRTVNVRTPHFMDRVEEAVQIVTDPEQSPRLSEEDRSFLRQALTELSRLVDGRGMDQLLHGEPHAGNILNTTIGPIFVDLETCCTGPIEFDVAHAPEEVGRAYAGIDPDLVRDFRALVLAMVTAWRWDRDDQLPNGRQLGVEGLGDLRATLGVR